ncbi:hypothetical protein PYW07_016171 [Mythimna separata]|uniref:Uncharacterized protein n=1 Tax=Mythimna separata TaxID=271217 RepID=A0AAD7YRE9_MYTSE|nr:hypothetical protein PYW07_016171 [Mythimna separata]
MGSQVILIIYLGLSAIQIVSAQLWEFGSDNVPTAVLMTRYHGKFNFFQKEQIIQLAVPQCHVITFVKVQVNNYISSPTVYYNFKLNTVTLQYRYWQYSPSTYVIIAKARKDMTSLWRATKNLKRPKDHVPPLRKQDGSWARTDVQKATAFAEHQENVLTPLPSPDPDKDCDIAEYLQSPNHTFPTKSSLSAIQIVSAQVWEFGADNVPTAILVTRYPGKFSFFQKEQSVQLTVPQCHVITFVKVEVSNYISNPAVFYNHNTHTITLKYKYWQYSPSTYVILAKGVRQPDCHIRPAVDLASRVQVPLELQVFS